MLYLNRKPGEAEIIDHCIEVRVVEIRGRTVKLGLTFPPEATVLREEVFEAIKEANRAALEAVHALPAVGDRAPSAANPSAAADAALDRER